MTSIGRNNRRSSSPSPRHAEGFPLREKPLENTLSFLSAADQSKFVRLSQEIKDAALQVNSIPAFKNHPLLDQMPENKKKFILKMLAQTDNIDFIQQHLPQWRADNISPDHILGDIRQHYLLTPEGNEAQIEGTNDALREGNKACIQFIIKNPEKWQRLGTLKMDATKYAFQNKELAIYIQKNFDNWIQLDSYQMDDTKRAFENGMGGYIESNFPLWKNSLLSDLSRRG